MFSIACVFYINEKKFFLKKSAHMSQRISIRRKKNPALFLCNLCNKIPCDPISSFCGHIFCWTCYNLAYNKTVKRLYCPSCYSYNNVDFFVPIYDSGANSSRDDDEEERRPLPRKFSEGVMKFVNTQTVLFSYAEEHGKKEFVHVEGVEYPVPQVFLCFSVAVLLIFLCILLSFYD